MPILSYKCECGISKKTLVRAKEIKTHEQICTCGKKMKRILNAPASVSKMIIDQGFQSKAIEVMTDIVEVMDKDATNAEQAGRGFGINSDTDPGKDHV